jgi:hypothetical protein
MASRSLSDLRDVTVAIIGIAEASPYKTGEASHSALAPAALRAASKAFLGQLNQFDFEPFPRARTALSPLTVMASIPP